MNKILIIDDQSTVRKLLKKILERHGYQIFEAKNSKEGYEQLKSKNIDLIILDVMLEDEAGFDICREYKSIDAFNHIPVIFLTGTEEANALNLAYEAGGVDFIQKPVESGSLLMRVKSSFSQIDAKRKLQQKHEELKAYQTIIIQEEKMAAVSRMVGGLSHELNNPLSCIKSNFSGLAKYLNHIKQEIETISQEHEEFHKRCKRHLDNCSDILEESSEEFNQLRQITDRLVTLDLPEDEEQSYCINEAIKNALTLNADGLNDCLLTLDLQELPTIVCHPASITESINGLLNNAIHSIKNAENKEIEIVSEIKGAFISVKISDSGCGIAPDVVPKIWDPFFTTKDIGEGSGLGLSSINNQMKALNGSATVTSKLGEGSTFTLNFPHK
ncbi:MAG: response regulator [Lentisphaerales bacterium]|nr:response regulator [Lentisphaerales bacterium]